MNVNYKEPGSCRAKGIVTHRIGGLCVLAVGGTPCRNLTFEVRGRLVEWTQDGKVQDLGPSE